MDVNEILREWELEQYIDIFEENAIDLESFNLLNEHLIKEIIPKIGHRLKFLKKFEEYKQNIREESNITEDLTFNINHSASEILLEVVEPEAYTEHVPANTVPNFLEPPNKIPNKGLFSREEFEIFLKKSSEWEVINKEHILNEYSRGKLAKVALDFLILNYSSKKIPHSSFLEISHIINKIFPQEAPEIYFVPYKGKTKTSPKILACGKLYSKYLNYKRITKKKEPLGEITNEIEIGESEKAANIFLKNNIGPECDILEAWEKTENIRKNYLSKSDINSYFENYPALKQPFGYNLLLIDFEKKFPDQFNNIYGNWPSVAKAILKLCKEKGLINEEDTLNIDTLAIKYLPQLFKAGNHRKSFGSIRSSKSEIKDSFLLELNNFGDLNEKIEERRRRLNKIGGTIQPFMLLIEDINKKVSSYVIINDTKYYIESSVKALDVCFKSFFSLDAKYPVESEQPPECLRKFSSINSFRKHVQREHISKIHSNVMNTIQPVGIENNFNLNVGTNDLTKNSSQNNLTSNSEKLTTDNINVITNNLPNSIAENLLTDIISNNDENTIAEFKNKLRQNMSLLIGKFYAKSIIPRNQVQQIILDLNDLLVLTHFRNITRKSLKYCKM
ncbi:unnamed protein product [Brassicogethes aeneus]|uniref:SAM domain-containing protein n=1 Tax=Brassicogethes aeneus TaxID=1431903 RepID=A0A9P0AVE6_BRAAE|nr:unnamed protein product [Brassicogethes aeneus]